ncbi:MAG: Taurine-transporting ATPase [Candidatus Magasanikbacteria bacterium GW2011_GWC2_40_17]|uniref:Taurine-transporting ATPase n=1 Tax=Candidatus Magasanikbacteria bacterium GW2011_GWA2_42_32 TaxID=1619039 RepID=A0A0G1A7T4_9BACT|nr:MAG: Taurine-transporting ATPase [Candidatus Magasanikbacteria bacterium GW2011_GWC2_40_17]KKS57090.1 MAG: Taurine-transporting ATPase [Candidatus Magasanikbacteria bacterium GW2011_GWA2_42_32]OGH85386.1 MAG: hypothetical protein A2294_01315 [Candidatus Magasanikbacteria bacterium RIFOXYB2_FULL_38_10]
MTASEDRNNAGIRFENDSTLPDVVSLVNISQTYDGGAHYIIKDLNLLVEGHAERGHFTVLMGTSGCGKSTLLRYIAGLQKPTKGEVLLHGKPLEGSVPMVFQTYSSLPWRTVLENVTLPLEIKGMGTPKEQRAAAMEMLRTVGLEDQWRKFAQHPILSGGQLQRVALARALVSNPELLLMDEPHQALDVNTRFLAQLTVSRLREKLKSTILLVTHDIQEAVFLADDIYIMAPNPGRIVQHIKVDLPSPRGREIRMDKRFVELVQMVEQSLFEVGSLPPLVQPPQSVVAPTVVMPSAAVPN